MNIEIKYDLFDKRYILVDQKCHKQKCVHMCSIYINLYCAFFGMHDKMYINIEDIYLSKRSILVVLKFKSSQRRVK